MDQVYAKRVGPITTTVDRLTFALLCEWEPALLALQAQAAELHHLQQGSRRWPAWCCRLESAQMSGGRRRLRSIPGGGSLR
jgi:hypothetical protein